MLRRFNLGCGGLLMLAAVMLLPLGASQQADAATVSPAKLDRPAQSTIASRVHCKKYRHYHKRCRYCPRYYHTCQKKKK